MVAVPDESVAEQPADLGGLGIAAADVGASILIPGYDLLRCSMEGNCEWSDWALGVGEIAVAVTGVGYVGRAILKGATKGAKIANAPGSAVDDIVPNVPVGRRTKIMSEADSSPHTPQHVNSPFQPVQNTPGTVNGIDYSGHAFDQMRNRGLVPSVVENALRTGVRTPGNTPGTTVVTDAANKVKVVINQSGRVMTVQ